MRLNEITYSGAAPVDGYGPGFFRIGDTVWNGPIVVLPSGVQEWTGTGDATPILKEAADIDVLIVGTGPEIAHIPPEFRNLLETETIGVEVMASPAACRTYNVLLAEGRRIALALLPV